MKSSITTHFETTQFAGIIARIVNADESPYTVLDMVIRPGFGAPAHISPMEDKLFILIQGSVRYLIGDKTEIAQAGARIQVAKGVIHGFRNVGEEDARHILISTPRHHENFFRALHNNSLLQRSDRVAEIAAQNDQQIVGPLP